MIGLGLSITQLAVRQLVGQFNPMKLFALGEQGAWYDPSDINLSWRRNLLTYSEQFDDGVWVKNNVTVAANTVVAPDGTLTADKLVENTSLATHYANQTQTPTSYAAYSFSCFAKAGERSVLWLGLGFTGGGRLGYNLLNGTVVAGTVSTSSGSITPVGNGWYRCTLGVTTTSTAAGQIQIGCTNAADASTVSYAGDGTSGIYIWGASLTTAANADKPYQKITDGVSDYFTYQPQPVLYQDAAGTTPVTAVEQPVGLMLDKSKGLVLGPELVVNGTFDTNIDGWTVGNTGQSTLSWESGKIRIARVNTGDTYPNARTVLSGLTVGRTYKIVSTTNNPFGIEAYHSIVSLAASLVRTTLASKTIECVFTATETTHRLDVGIWATSGAVGQYVEFDNISVRELPGAHAFQTTATSRPVLSARVNRLLATETLATQTVTTLATTQRLRFEGTGSITLSGTGTGTFAAGTHTVTTTAGTLTVTVSGSVLRADLREANNAIGSPDYQRVNTATDYDAGPDFPRYLRCDGIDDWMVTGTITPGTDKAQVFAGLRKLSAATGIVAELSASIALNNGVIQLVSAQITGTTDYAFVSKGNTSGAARGTGFPSPTTNVLSGIGDISGDVTTLRVNGAQAAQSTADQGTGNYLAYPLYIGRRGGTTLPFNGHIYGLIIRFGPNLPIETIQQTEAYMAAKTGVTL